MSNQEQELKEIIIPVIEEALDTPDGQKFVAWVATLSKQERTIAIEELLRLICKDIIEVCNLEDLYALESPPERNVENGKV